MLEKMVLRNYRIKWRFNISISESEDTNSNSKHRFLSYYMPKWSELMKTIMSDKISVDQIKRIPDLRRICLDEVITVERLIDLISKKDKSIESTVSKKLINVAPLFDASPMDLKLYILSTFNILPEELKFYLQSN